LKIVIVLLLFASLIILSKIAKKKEAIWLKKRIKILKRMRREE